MEIKSRENSQGARGRAYSQRYWIALFDVERECDWEELSASLTVSASTDEKCSIIWELSPESELKPRMPSLSLCFTFIFLIFVEVWASFPILTSRYLRSRVKFSSSSSFHSWRFSYFSLVSYERVGSYSYFLAWKRKGNFCSYKGRRLSFSALILLFHQCAVQKNKKNEKYNEMNSRKRVNVRSILARCARWHSRLLR